MLSQGTLAKTVQIENYVDISTKHWDNMELAMRIETSVDNDNVFYTDSNGFQVTVKQAVTPSYQITDIPK